MSIITTGPSGGAPNRLEIYDFVKHEKFFSLYVQALNIMQTKVSQAVPSSFFQIGGIHGLPYTAWDGVQGVAPLDPKSEYGGYCNHGNVLFPTWHRPYVVLYEQLVQQYAKEVAATYTVDCEVWKKAANHLRQPYWDWAVNSTPPDEVIVLKEVTITGPHGHKITVRNPLYSYDFHPIDDSFRDAYKIFKYTVRYPSSVIPDPVPDLNTLKATLKSNQTTWTNDTYKMLTGADNWPAFSHTSVKPGNSGEESPSVNSLEAIHNYVHYGIGGPNGHMSEQTVAGFDPVFFLHHSNVDRLLSLWSVLHPGIWVSSGNSGGGTFDIQADSEVDIKTPLTPFRISKDEFWISSGIEDTVKFGYTYPDFNDLDLNNRSAVFTAIANRVNQLYGVDTSAPVPSTPAPAIPAPGSAPGEGHPGLVHPRPNHGNYDWTARIEVKKFEVGQSFSVYIFLGVPPADPAQWALSPNFAGLYYSFVNSAAEQCANCVKSKDVLVEGFVHLNLAIAKYPALKSLSPDIIEPFLKKELHWRVQKVDGEPIDLKSLEVSVFSTPLTYPPGTFFPVPGQRRHHRQITYGRPGGCRHL